MITAEQIKALRERTGVSIGECKKALEAASGDLEQAIAALRTQSAATAEKKSGRTLGAGVVSSYLHTTGTVGVLLELGCETDFVAKNADFKQLADDLAMHVAAFNPVSVEELATQPFIKDQTLTVADLVKSAVQKFGERTEIMRFSRFEVGA